MDLTEIVGNAALGFGFGFMVGATRYQNRIVERAEYLEAAYTGKEIESLGATKEERARDIGWERMMRFALPTYFGIANGLVSSVVLDRSALGTAAVSVPAALLGMMTGNGARYLGTRKYRESLEALREMRENPDRTFDYMPDYTRGVVQEGLAETERMVLAGESINPEDQFSKLLNEKITVALHAGPRAHVEHLQRWIHEQFGETGRRANIQREVSRFYERADGETVVILGPSKNPSICLYELNDGQMHIMTTSLGSIRIIRDEGEGSTSLRTLLPKFEVRKNNVWNENYRALAEDIAGQVDERTIMLRKTDALSAEILRPYVVVDTFSRAQMR